MSDLPPNDIYVDEYLDTYAVPGGGASDHDVDAPFVAVGDTVLDPELDAGASESFTGAATGALTVDPTVVPVGIDTDAGAVAYGAAGALSVTVDPTVEGPGGQDITVATVTFGARGWTYAQPERLRRRPRRWLLAGPTAEISSALEAAQIEVWRVVDILNPDETLWASEVGFTDGKVSVDMTRDERRTVDLTLDNFDRSLRPSPDGFWYDKILRVRRGVVVDSVRYEFDLGYFMIDQIGRPDNTSIAVSGRDYAKKMINDKIEAALTFPVKTNIMDLIKAVAYNAGITRVDVPFTTETTRKEFTFDADTPRWEIVKEVATTYGYDIYFAATGTLTVRAQVDPVTTPPILTFGESSGNTIDLTPSTNDGLLYNHVVVVSSSAESELPVWASVENNEPSSPTRISRIGRRTKRIESALATTKAQCLEIATNFLRVSGLEQFDIGLAALNYPWLDVGEIVELDDPEAAQTDPTRYLLSTLEFPLTVGPMNGSCKRVSIVGATATTSPDAIEGADLVWGDEAA